MGHHGRLMRRKLRALHYAAQSSVGVEAGAQSVSSEISFLVEKLRLINCQVRRIEEALVRLVDETEEGEYLLSIIGLNYISVAGILAELGSFRSYHNARQLIKMAGTNPTESESGGKRGIHTPMSKKGRTGLRYCAWTGVISLLRHNPDFQDWAKKLRQRPVHANPLKKKEVVGAAINRLLRLAFALVKKQSLYQMPQLLNVANQEVIVLHQVGREMPIADLGAQYEQTRSLTWCPCPPGQTRMKYDGPSSLGVSPYLTAN